MAQPRVHPFQHYDQIALNEYGEAVGWVDHQGRTQFFASQVLPFATWQTRDPVVPLGVMAVDSTSRSMKLGDGVKCWSDLPIATDQEVAALGASLAALNTAVGLLQASSETKLPPATVNESGTAYTLVAQDFTRRGLRTNSGVANLVVAPTPQSLGVADGMRLPIRQIGIGPTRVVAGSGAQVAPAGVDQIRAQMSEIVLEALSPTLWGLSGDLAETGGPVVTVGAGITGSGKVGELLTGVDPTLASGAITTRQMLKNGQVIAASATYTPVLDDIGADIQFQSVVAKAGFPSVTSTSPAVRVVANSLVPEPTSLPVIEAITGNREGDTVRLHVPAYSNAPTGTPGHTIVLKRGAATIQTFVLPAATLFQDYTIVALDVSQQLTISVTGTNASGSGNAATSLAFQVAGPKPVYNGGATITPSSPVEGDLLTASFGSVSGNGVTLTPTWHYVNGPTLPPQTPPNQYQTHGALVGNPPVQGDGGRQMFVRWVAANAGGSITFDTPSVSITAAGGTVGIATNNGIPHGGQQIFPEPGGPTTLQVGPRPWGIHATKYTQDYGGVTERMAFPLNTTPKSFRVYGAHRLKWNTVDPSANGSRDWTHWDLANSDWQRVGVASVTYNLHGVPAGYRLQPEPPTGEWGMQLTAVGPMKQWLTDLCTRYPIIDYVEVANEFWTGSFPGNFWGGSRNDLMTLCNQVLDWRNEFLAATGRYIKIQAPSTPGTVGHANEQLSFFDDYNAAFPGRAAEFDSFSIHLYGGNAQNIRQTSDGAGPGLVTLRNGMNARSWGIGKEIRDGEHGFFSPPNPWDPHNMILASFLGGSSGTDFFFWGETASSGDTHLGQPDINATMRAGYEFISQYANATITRITTGAPGTFWAVDYITGGETTPPPPGGGGGGGGSAPGAPVVHGLEFNPTPAGALPPTGVGVTATAALPAGVADGERLLMAVVNVNTGVAQTTPTGWILLNDTVTPGGVNGLRMVVYERAAGPAEPASYDVALSSSTAWLAGVVRMSAAFTGGSNLVSATGTPQGAPLGVPHPGMTTLGANARLFAFAAQWSPGGTTWSGATDWTDLGSIWHQHGPNMEVLSKTQPAAGASGGFTVLADGDTTNNTVITTVAYITPPA